MFWHSFHVKIIFHLSSTEVAILSQNSGKMGRFRLRRSQVRIDRACAPNSIPWCQQPQQPRQTPIGLCELCNLKTTAMRKKLAQGPSKVGDPFLGRSDVVWSPHPITDSETRPPQPHAPHTCTCQSETL